jgi:hypothetical protein
MWPSENPKVLKTSWLELKYIQAKKVLRNAKGVGIHTTSLAKT